jgi:hypothetical protein
MAERRWLDKKKRSRKPWLRISFGKACFRFGTNENRHGWNFFNEALDFPKRFA